MLEMSVYYFIQFALNWIIYPIKHRGTNRNAKLLGRILGILYNRIVHGNSL